MGISFVNQRLRFGIKERRRDEWYQLKLNFYALFAVNKELFPRKMKATIVNITNF